MQTVLEYCRGGSRCIFTVGIFIRSATVAPVIHFFCSFGYLNFTVIRTFVSNIVSVLF